MSDIIYRKLKKRDYAQIKEIINQSFNLYSYMPNKKILDYFLESYLYGCLAEATFSCVAELDGKIIGVINGNAERDYNLLTHLPHLIKVTWYEHKIKTLSKKLNANSDKQEAMRAAYAKFLDNATCQFDGVLTLFAVLEQSRGKGVGTELLNRLFSYYRANKVERIYLFTDSSCNYAFYDHKGFTRADQTSVSLTKNNNPYTLEVFFYTRTFCNL